MTVKSFVKRVSILAVSITTLGIVPTLFYQSCTSIPHNTHPEKSPLYMSPLAIAADREGTVLYVAEATAGQVAVFDRAQNTVSDVITLRDNPSGLVLSDDGSRLYVTCSVPDGSVEIIDTARKKVTGSIRVGHSPCSPVLSPDGTMLYVCNRFDNTLSVIDLKKMKEIRKAPMLREPVAADITPDGRYVFIANHLPSGGRIAEYITDGGVYMVGGYQSAGYFNTDREVYVFSGVILVYDTFYNRLVELLPLPKGSTGLRGLCVSPDGRHVYVTHVLAHYNLPTTQLERGMMNTNALSILDAKKLKYVNTVLLDDLDCGAANPWDVMCSEDGKNICIAHAGTHEISIIDRQGLHERLDSLTKGIITTVAASIEDVPIDLSFLTGLRRRIILSGKGPRGLALAGSKIFAAEYFTDTIGVVDIKDGTAIKTESVFIGSEKSLTPERKGEMYFNDADLCFQKWQTCASCHPDGRTDGLNWDLLNDGIGNPKNTKSLLLSHVTPPVMATGVRKNAETAVRAGVTHIQFTVRDEAVASAVDAYLRSLKPVPSPYLVDGELSKYAKRGKKIFIHAGCAECHPAPLFTDLNKYNVGTGVGSEQNINYDTPTLIEMWRTVPYLNDGRADTMFDVLTKFNLDDRHGEMSKLKVEEIYDLLEYIMSL